MSAHHALMVTIQAGVMIVALMVFVVVRFHRMLKDYRQDQQRQHGMHGDLHILSVEVAYREIEQLREQIERSRRMAEVTARPLARKRRPWRR